MTSEKSVVEQAADALRLWSNAWNEFDKTGKNKPETLEEVIAPFIEMEKEEKIEFACQVAEASAMKYIQGKTTRMIAEELLTFKSE